MKNVVARVRNGGVKVGAAMGGLLLSGAVFAQTGGTTIDPTAVSGTITGNQAAFLAIGAAVLGAVALLACLKLAKRAV